MKYILALLIYLFLSNPALAGEAHICSTKEQVSPKMDALTDKTMFDCPGLGSRTVPELAKEGWQVSMPAPVGRTDPSQPIKLLTSWKMLIEKADKPK